MTLMVVFPQLVSVTQVHFKSFNMSKIVVSFGIYESEHNKIIMVCEQKYERIISGPANPEENKKHDQHDRKVMKIPKNA